MKLNVSCYTDPGVYVAEVDDSALEPETALWVLRWTPQGAERVLNSTLTYGPGPVLTYAGVLGTTDLEEACSRLFFPGEFAATRIDLLRAGREERYTVFTMDNVRDLLKRLTA